MLVCCRCCSRSKSWLVSFVIADARVAVEKRRRLPRWGSARCAIPASAFSASACVVAFARVACRGVPLHVRPLVGGGARGGEYGTPSLLRPSISPRRVQAYQNALGCPRDVSGRPGESQELVEILGMLQEALGGVQAQNALECPRDISARPGEFQGASGSW